MGPPEMESGSTLASPDDILQNAIVLTEMAINLKERCTLAENHLLHLKTLFAQCAKTIETLQLTSKHSLQQAKKILSAPTTEDHEKLLELIERQLGDLHEDNEEQEKSKQRISASGSNKSVKCDIDEKYPESWSRDSSIDLNSVNNLPPVPEDVFTSFTSVKPRRSLSLSSLKSMRKVKLCLQKAESSDDEEQSSDNEDHVHDGAQKGDTDDVNLTKKFLRNIKEESQD